MSDPTGNRRWLPYEIESILSPREHPFNYEGIYAQAYALYKSDFRYWFTDEEIEKQNRHNRAFEAPRLEQELVDLYFRKPTEAETGEFMPIARELYSAFSALCSLSPLSPCHPEVGCFRDGNQRLTMQKSVTYDMKIRDL